MAWCDFTVRISALSAAAAADTNVEPVNELLLLLFFLTLRFEGLKAEWPEGERLEDGRDEGERPDIPEERAALGRKPQGFLVKGALHE